MSAPLALGTRRLVVVTGKGGVGKSTVAAALARAAAHHGRRVLAVDVESSGLARMLGVDAAPAEPTTVAPGIAVAALDAPRALAAFVHGMMPFGLVARRLLESGTFQVVAAAAPGLPEYLILSAISGWLGTTRFGRWRWDLVVIDAPASGHSLPLLMAPHTLGAIAHLGPAGRSLRRMGSMLSDPAHTAVWLVTLPEELPVRETIELYRALTRDGALPVAPPIVNDMPAQRFTAADARVLSGPDVDPTHPMIAGARLVLSRRHEALVHVASLRRALGSPVTLAHRPAGPESDDLAAVSAALARATGLGT